MTLPLFLIGMSLGVSLAVTPWIRGLAIRRGIGDYPSSRKIHTKFIPRMGGVGIIAGFIGGMTVAWLWNPQVPLPQGLNLAGVAGAVLLVVGLGIYDDIKGVGSLGKLTLQCLASAAVIFSGLRIESLTLPFAETLEAGAFSIPITVLWLVGVTNAVNLLDGLDGLAAGVAAIVAASFLCIGLYTRDMLIVYSTAALLFACLGFLRYNFHPASIFMGDTGSLFLGFLLACISLLVMQHSSAEVTPISILVPVAALAVPIVDTSVAFFRRLRRGMHPLKADKEHIHHRLMDLGLTHRQTVAVNYAISIVYGFIAFLLVLIDSLYAVILLLFVFGSAFFAIRRLGYIEDMTAKKQDSSLPIQPLSIARIIDRAVLVTGDAVAIIIAFLVSYWFRFHSGLFMQEALVPLEAYIQSPAMLILAVAWLLIFVLAGLYEIPWDVSRIDYTFLILRTVATGSLFLFFVTMDFESVTLEGRLTTLLYGANVAFFVVLFRMLIVAYERRHEILGFRRRNTLVIGTTKVAQALVEEIRTRPGLKYNVVGFIDRQVLQEQFMDLPVLGTHDKIPEVVKQRSVEEILIATSFVSREEILDILARCNGMVPSIKVVPESTDVLSGFKTEEVIGHPLIRLYPTNLKAWQRATKRMIDLIVSMSVLIPLLPFWVLIAVLIKLDSRGPVFFVQERVGRKGWIFKLYKFRSMVIDAERDTGPVWATPDDKRITRVGRILRKLRLDEVPQFLNVLKGEMSLVGPRPERPYFVEQLKKEVKFYSRRLLVRPGITGWAQVRHRYDRSLEDVKEKIKYDLFYLENMSITLDLKILFRTILVALTGRGTH